MLLTLEDHERHGCKRARAMLLHSTGFAQRLRQAMGVSDPLPLRPFSPLKSLAEEGAKREPVRAKPQLKTGETFDRTELQCGAPEIFSRCERHNDQHRDGIGTTVTSKESGTYQFPPLQPGTYKVSAELSGFQPQTYNQV